MSKNESVISKQDGAFTRTASDLERKYNFGQKFSEILGLIDDSRDRVDSVESALRNEISEQYSVISRNAESIMLEALTKYVKTEDLNEFETTLKGQLQVMAENITMNFYKDSIESLTDESGNLSTRVTNLEKHFIFDVDGVTIKSSAGEPLLKLNNDEIVFIVKNAEGTRITPKEIETGNIFVHVDEQARFGNYAFVPFEEGDADGLDLVRVSEGES